MKKCAFLFDVYQKSFKIRLLKNLSDIFSWFNKLETEIMNLQGFDENGNIVITAKYTLVGVENII